MRISQDTNSFVYCCNNCTNQLVSSTSACRYHCIFCDDYDLCLRCFQSSRHQHRLEKMDFTSPSESHSSSNSSSLNIYESPEGREAAVQRCLNTLVHAIRCRGFDCTSNSCRKIKQLFVHRRVCQRRGAGSCGVCKQTTRLLYLHGVRCQDSQCPAPFCSVIKDRVRRQRLILRMRTVVANRPLAFRTALRAATRPANHAPGLGAGGTRTTVSNQGATFPRSRLAALRTASATRVALATLRTASFNRPLAGSSTSGVALDLTSSNSDPDETVAVTRAAAGNAEELINRTIFVESEVRPNVVVETVTVQESSSTSAADSGASPAATVSRAPVSIVHTSLTPYPIYSSPKSLIEPVTTNRTSAYINETVLEQSPCPGPSSRSYSSSQPILACAGGRPARVIARCKMMYEADDSGEETERIEMSSDSEPEDMPLSELKGRTHK